MEMVSSVPVAQQAVIIMMIGCPMSLFARALCASLTGSDCLLLKSIVK